MLILLVGCGPPASRLSSPPAGLGFDSFFTKYVDAAGVPIVSGPEVDDAALYEAQRLVLAVRLEGQGEHASLEGWHVEAFPERGGVASLPGVTTTLGDVCGLAEAEDRRISVNAESLLCAPSAGCRVGSVLLHEVGHASLWQAANAALWPSIERAYSQAIARGAWSHSYGRTNASEYWAEGVQIWFDAKPERLGDGIHTRAQLEAYDPELAGLLTQVFGSGQWRYHCPR